MKRSIRYTLVVILLCFFAMPDTGTCQTWDWAIGTKGNNNYGRFSSTDSFCNVYVTGETFTGMNFPSYTIPNVGYTRVYLSKFDSAGNLAWVKTNTGRNTTGRIGTMGIATDGYGDTYVLGCFDTVISFDANTLANAYLGSYTGASYLSYLFLAKFDAAGNNKWIKNIGNFPTAWWNAGNTIRADCDGNIYMICNYYKDAAIGSYSFLNSDTSGNTADVLVAKLDSGGNVLWARQIGNDSDDYVVNIALGSTGDIYISGTFFHYSLSVGADTVTDSVGTTGMGISFIAKLDNSGTPIWARISGDGAYAPYITDMVVSSGSELFVTGQYTRDLDLGTFSLPYAYGNNSYLAKYDITGNLSWAKVIRGVYVPLEGITLDGCGDAWVMGHFGGGILTTNDTIDGHIVTPPIKNREPLFVAGWSSTGSYIGASVLASGGRSSFRISMVTDKVNKLYVVGNNTLDTLHVAGDVLYGTTSYTNMFLAKYDPATACSPYQSLNCKNISPTSFNVSSTGISIFPNPSNAEFTIRSDDGGLSGMCTVIDVKGQVMNRYPLRAYETNIPVSDLPAGVYILKVEMNEGGLINRKIIVMH